MILDFAKSGDKASARAITLACEYFFFFSSSFSFRTRNATTRATFKKGVGMEDIFFLFCERYSCKFYFLSLSLFCYTGTCARRA